MYSPKNFKNIMSSYLSIALNINFICQLLEHEEMTDFIQIWCLETRIDVYETFCPQQMLVHKGAQINNVQLITGMGSAEM